MSKNGKEQNITVYFADASVLEDESLFADLHSMVRDSRREKTDRYHFRKDKNLSLCAEYLLMCGCEDYGISYRDQEVSFGSHKKPFFRGADICFNLSHSEERAMCAMGRPEVGCDIEKIGRVREAVAETVCSPEELAALSCCASEEENNRLFYRLWTLKESLIKCTGEGLSTPLREISMVSGGKPRTVYDTGGEIYYLYEGCLDGEYQYALCVNAGRMRSSSRDEIKSGIRFEKKEIQKTAGPVQTGEERK